MNNMQLTPHFTLEELATTSLAAYKSKNIKEAKRKMGKMYMLAGFAERIREIIGYPLIVTSGYRCDELNKAVGGALVSQHTLCEAIDIVCKENKVETMFQKIKNSDLKYGQMIIETNKAGSEWLHISIGSNRQRMKYEPGKGNTLLK